MERAISSANEHKKRKLELPNDKKNGESDQDVIQLTKEIEKIKKISLNSKNKQKKQKPNPILQIPNDIDEEDGEQVHYEMEKIVKPRQPTVDQKKQKPNPILQIPNNIEDGEQVHYEMKKIVKPRQPTVDQKKPKQQPPNEKL